MAKPAFSLVKGAHIGGTIYLAAAFRDVLNSTHVNVNEPVDAALVSNQLEAFFTQCVHWTISINRG